MMRAWGENFVERSCAGCNLLFKYKIVFGNCVSVRTGLWNTSMWWSICAKGEKKLLVNTIWWTLNGNLCRVTKMIWDRAKSIFQVFPVTYIGSVSKRLGRLCASPHSKQNMTIVLAEEEGWCNLLFGAWKIICVASFEATCDYYCTGRSRVLLIWMNLQWGWLIS